MPNLKTVITLSQLNFSYGNRPNLVRALHGRIIKKPGSMGFMDEKMVMNFKNQKKENQMFLSFSVISHL